MKSKIETAMFDWLQRGVLGNKDVAVNGHPKQKWDKDFSLLKRKWN